MTRALLTDREREVLQHGTDLDDVGDNYCWHVRDQVRQRFERLDRDLQLIAANHADADDLFTDLDADIDITLDDDAEAAPADD